MSQQHSESLQRILMTTEEIVREKGCSSTTLQEIINRTGLSKGAIYHYVKSKDELFGLILQSRMEELNNQFNEAVGRAETGELHGPLHVIQQGFVQYFTGEQTVANQIFLYLLSQKDNPSIAAVLTHLHEYSLQTCTRWIQIGQQYGAIPSTVEANKIASMMLVFSYGMRVQNQIPEGALSFDARDVLKMLLKTFQSS